MKLAKKFIEREARQEVAEKVRVLEPVEPEVSHRRPRPEPTPAVPARAVEPVVVGNLPKHKLFYGDNLDVLRKKIPDESVDLCYIDPPFNSKRNYNQIYNNVGKEDRAQAQAFTDTWTWDDFALAGYNEIFTNEGGRFTKQTIELIKGLKAVLGEGSLMAYLISITLRAVEIQRVLKTTGSFYLHCDPTASHYLKVVLDSVFCPMGGTFNNEIVWRRTGAHGAKRSFGPIHDTLLFYTKSAKDFYFNQLKRPYMLGHVERRYTKDENGYKFTSGGNVLTGAGATNGESGTYNKIQIVTIKEIIEEGKRLDLPLSLEVLRKAAAPVNEEQLPLL
jgi:DNA modification methylase